MRKNAYMLRIVGITRSARDAGVRDAYQWAMVCLLGLIAEVLVNSMVKEIDEE